MTDNQSPIANLQSAIPIIALAGMAILLFATRWGIGISPDSVAYIGAARNVAAGNGFTAYDAVTPLTQFPPLYSLGLVLFGLGANPIAGARWLNIVLFGANIILAGVSVSLFAPRLRHTAAVTAILVAVAVPFVSIHLMAWTEPLFLFFAFSGLILLALYLDSPKTKLAAGAAVFIGLGFLTRYAGAALILTGAAVLLFSARPLRRKIVDLAVFSAVSVSPMLLWMVRNRLVAGTATNRAIAFHPVSTGHLWQLFYTVSGWLAIPATAPNAVRFGVWVAIAGAVGAAFFLARRKTAPARRNFGGVPPIITVLVLFGVIYLAFLAVSISFLDANTPLDDRILSPAFVTGAVVAAYAVDRLLSALKNGAAFSVAMLAVAAILVGSLFGSGKLLLESYRGGLGFANLSWRQSALWAEIEQFPAAAPIYSNIPEAVYLYTGRAAFHLPKAELKTQNARNENYRAEMVQMQEKLAAERGLLVYFNRLSGRTINQSEIETLPLSVVFRAPDGVVYVMDGVQGSK